MRLKTLKMESWPLIVSVARDERRFFPLVKRETSREFRKDKLDSVRDWRNKTSGAQLQFTDLVT